MYELKHGDCLELMKNIPDCSVDMVLCDLPYGILNKTNSRSKWDCVIPFDKLWSFYNRITKENAAIVLFASNMFTANLMKSNEKMWRYNLVWDKVVKTGFLNAKRMPLRQHEDICVFYKKMPTYNPQMTKCDPNKRNHSKGNLKTKHVNSCYGNFIEVPTTISDEKYPTSIISFSKEHVNGNFLHPTQKPVNLLEYLIRTYTNVGETVLDNCMGSSSTGVACLNTNRNFIGIELDESYFNVAKNRIEENKRSLEDKSVCL